MQDEKPVYALLLSTEASFGEYVTASFTLIQIETGQVRNPSHNSAENELMLKCQREEGRERPTADGQWYAFDVRYQHRSHITLRDCEKMVKKLRQVHRKLDKMNEELGSAEGMAQHVARFALAVGAEHVYKAEPTNRTSYSEMVFDKLVPRRVEEWKELQVPSLNIQTEEAA